MRFIDLFAGVGGFHYGIQKMETQSEDSTNNTGATPQHRERAFHCVYSNEYDKYANSVYRKHFGKCDDRDVRTVATNEIPDHDLLCAGFPCQAFSVAGKRRGFEDTRGTLFFEIARIATEKRPRYLLLENVKGLLSHDNGKTFQTILGVLTDLGYECEWQVLNSKHFGVPQNRERVFIVGHLRGECSGKVFPVGENNQAFAKELTKNVSQVDRVYSAKGVSPTIPTSGGGRHEPKIGISVDRGVLKEKGIANTIDANYHKGLDNHQARTEVMQDVRIRRLTPKECERLQGFPDDWTKYGADGEEMSDTQRYKMMGNAVTANVITAIINKLVVNPTESEESDE